MRRVRFTLPIVASLAATFVAVPGAAASKPGDTEHGVNRAKLMAKAERVVEERNGIEVLKVNRCGPQKKKKKRLNFSKWVCPWRAEGIFPGQIPYRCKGKAVYKRKRRRWRIDPCQNQMQPMVPLADVPGPPPTFGYNEDFIFQSVPALDLLDVSGAKVARVPLPWAGVEPAPGSFNWWGSDVLYSRLRARGIRPLWVLVGAPCFAQKDPGACAAGDNRIRPEPSYYDDFGQFAVRVAKRYPESAGLEIWNEPNYPKFWGGPPDPAKYASMLITVADAVHAGAPGMPVVNGGLSPHADSETSGAIGYRNFLIEMYERGAIQHVDAVGIHPYPGVGPTEDWIGDVRVQLGKIQNVMDRYGDYTRPLWVTEFGVTTTGNIAFDPDAAGQAVVQLLEMFRRVRGIQLAIVHRFVEDPSGGGREAGYGVLRPNLAPKPAFCDLADLYDGSVAGLCE